MHTTALPPGFVPRATALVDTFVSHKSSSALVKRHLQRNTFRAVYGIEIGSNATSDVAETTFTNKVNVQNLPDSKQVIEDAVWFVEPFAFKKGQTISIKSESLTLQADEDTLKRILINLISNAINFSPAKSKIEVGVSFVQGLAMFSVKDEGPGIAAENLESIFDANRQVTNKTVGEVLGSGLGLSICKELVQSLGGRIGVGTSESGSYFWFAVPVV